MSKPLYFFDLECPRCNKTTVTWSSKREPSPHVNCGDCLMDDCEIVEFKVVRVQREPRTAAGSLD